MKTPFIWDSEARNIHSPTVHIVLGSRTKLPSVKTKFSVSPSVIKRDVVLAFPDDPAEYSSQVFYYKIWWKNPSDSLVFSVECDNSSIDTISHVIYVKQGGAPTSGDHELTKTIAPGDWNDVGFTYILPANFYSKPCIVYFAVHVTSSKCSNNVNVADGRRKDIWQYSLFIFCWFVIFFLYTDIY